MCMAEDVVPQAKFKTDHVDPEKVSTNPSWSRKHDDQGEASNPINPTGLTLPRERFGLWRLRFGLSLWGSMSLWVNLVPEESV